MVLFCGAMVASLFFNGSAIEFFAISMGFLWLLALGILWQKYQEGFTVPRSALALMLTLFWSWLGLSLFWSPVPYVSAVNFWWIGSVVFVYWLATLTPKPAQCWSATAFMVFIIGMLLAGMALYQLTVLNSDPRSTFPSRNSHAALLLLIAMPASGYFLIIASNIWRPLLGLALFVLFLAIAVTGSRGVMLSLLLAVVAVAIVACRQISHRRLVAWLGMIILAYVVAYGILGGWLVGRLTTAFEPAYAGHDRLLIWSQAWKMLQDAPWFGIGLGTYWLFWPPYRDPRDSSAGFYVHNDYLQIWIEAGLPGLLLLLAIEIAVFAAFIRLLRASQTTTARRIEAAGLFGGLLAIGAHAFIDFDLYVQPILLVAGLLLARLQHLGAATASFALRPASRFGLPAWRAITLLLSLFPLLYFIALGLSAWLTLQGRELAGQARWIEANQALTRAWQLMPTSDLTLIVHADLLRQAGATLPSSAQSQRDDIYREALALLAKAETNNPARAQIPYLRGLIYQEYPAAAGPDGQRLAAESYRQALQIDPRAYWARMAYAQILVTQGHVAKASDVLEGGVDYEYSAEPNVMSYFYFAAALRSQTGNSTGAEALRRQVERQYYDRRVRENPFGPKIQISPPITSLSTSS